MDAPTKAVTFLCSTGLAGALGAASARAGLQRDPGPNGHTELNRDEHPCDAEARGRVAFDRRNPRVSSNERELDRGFVRADEREAVLAYLRKL